MQATGAQAELGLVANAGNPSYPWSRLVYIDSMFDWFNSLKSSFVAVLIGTMSFLGIGGEHPEPRLNDANIPVESAEISTEDQIKNLQDELLKEKEERLKLEKKVGQPNKTVEVISPKTEIPLTPKIEITAQSTLTTLTAKQIVTKVSPSVALISAADGTGTGVVISAGKYIITNAHVVGDDAFVDIYLPNASFRAPVLGRNSKVDLAIIYSGGKNLTPVTLGNSDNNSLTTGDDVFALGFPLSTGAGLKNLTLTTGVISARQIPSWSSISMLQTDAALNFGNSGGPLLNDKGELIGINTSRPGSLYESQGIAFAVPVDTVKDYVPSLSLYGQSRYELNPIGSTYDIRQSVLTQMELNDILTCAQLNLRGGDLTACEFYRNYPGDYKWNIIKNQ